MTKEIINQQIGQNEASIEKGTTNPNLLALEMLCEALNIHILDIFPPKQPLEEE